jgi:UDP-N-acetyl-D-mannosaminuronic acid transferase (WecB/TagA/CpsF family)
MPDAVRSAVLEKGHFLGISTDELESLCSALHKSGNSRVLNGVGVDQQPIWLARNQSTIRPPGTPSIHATKYFMTRGVAS